MNYSIIYKGLLIQDGRHLPMCQVCEVKKWLFFAVDPT